MSLADIAIEITKQWQGMDMKKPLPTSLNISGQTTASFFQGLVLQTTGKSGKPGSSSALSCCQETAHILSTFTLQLQALPHPKAVSICVLESEPQALGSLSISTEEHVRGASDEITLWYIYKHTVTDWKCMLGWRNKEKKSSLSPGNDLQDSTALSNKTKVISQTCKHFSANCWSHRLHFSVSLGAAKRKQAGHHYGTAHRKCFALATDLLNR